jgi:GT2 family glycosyltransferase
VAARASVVIPIYQRMDLTRACLASLERAGLDGVEVVLVDNASTDGMHLLLDEWETSARVIRNPENRGFATACNQGAEAATAPVVVFLNTDTEVHEGWLEPLLDAVDDPAVGFAGPRLLYPNGRVQHCGMALLPGCLPFHIHRGVPGDHPVATQTRDLAILTAACAAIRSEVFREAGGFDTGYRNGFEDTDLCLKLATRGYVGRYRGDSVVIHYESMSPGRLDHDVHNMARFRTRWRTWTPDFSARLREDGIDGAGPGNTLWVGPLFDDSPEATLGRAAVVALAQEGLAPVVRETVHGHASAGVECPPEVVAGLNRWALSGPGLRCFQHIGAGEEFSFYDAMGSSVAVVGPGAVGDIAGIRSADAVIAIGQALAESAATIAPERTTAAVDGSGVESAAAAVIGAAPRMKTGVGWLGPVFGAGTTADLSRAYLGALAATGRPVRLTPRDEVGVGAEDLPPLGRQDFEPALWIVAAEWHDPAGPELWEQTALSLARPLIGVTVPTAPVAPCWVAACESVCEVWVPTDGGRRVLVEAGVDAEKVFVMAVPVSVEHFSPNPEVPADPFTMVAEVDWSSPAGWQEILQAWVQEFSADDPVRLVLYGPDEFGNAASRVMTLLADLGCDAEAIPDVELLLEPLSVFGLAEAYRAAHAAYVAPEYDPAELHLARATSCGLRILRTGSDVRGELRRAFEGLRAAPSRKGLSIEEAARPADARLDSLLG